ncbi:MAG: hypothetical protein A2289_05675 [Deltaproteobacteria bacterium RIFOXYA12_FULL_58_15]|nr:MAG: hypothetical protein A2289_05675 [Deltaproteobacteria bacterium RIFOXYA12_FULL_58_15]OGR07531.1 MAG: hypothetical protein A2341_26495 [Deltaproteobacteria bacterium RIFOXYB12_FULL_58_9]
MDFSLSSDQVMLQETVARFVADRVIPRARKWEEESRIPDEVFAELVEMGLLGVTVSEEWDGAGLGLPELCIVVEELARGDAALALGVVAHVARCAGAIETHGTAAQKKDLLRALAQGEILGTAAVGGAPELSATHNGGGWIVSGTKAQVPLGQLAEVAVISAMTDTGPTAFVVKKGMFSVTASDAPLGMCALGFADWHFDKQWLADEQRLVAVGAWAEEPMVEVALASLGVGIAHHAVEVASAYAEERKQFGRPIAEFQGIQWKLADAATKAGAAAMLVARAASLAASGAPFSTEAAMAKNLAGDAAKFAADQAVQIHGGFGYTRDFLPELLYRDAQVIATVGMPRNEQRTLVAQTTLRGVMG